MHRRFSVITGLILAAALFLAVPAAHGDYSDLRIVDSAITAGGTQLKVTVHNPGPPTTAAISATAAVSGGVTQMSISQPFFIRHGETLTVTVSFCAPILGVTEGPDPIPD